MKLIPAPLYRKILAVMPVPCVDIAVVYKDKFLILKRQNNPEKGKWWPPGGRILKGESLEEAARRKIREETGISTQKVQFLGADSTVFKNSAFIGVSSHTVNFIFLAELQSIKDIKLDSQSSEHRWLSRVDSEWHPYVKKVFRLAGFR